MRSDRMDVVLTMSDRGAGKAWHEAFCTPRCAYDWWRTMLTGEYNQWIEPDLLFVVADDIYHAISDIESFEGPHISAERACEISECWARLGHVLGLLNVTPEQRLPRRRISVLLSKRKRHMGTFRTVLRKRHYLRSK